MYTKIAYTVYVSPYMTVTADRYTKHYFSNSQRIASKLGTGEFDNVYGVNNFHLTAGKKDYAERMVQIEESRQEYMKQNGIPPGVPTQKGQNIEPEITGVALPNAPLGNYDVPDGWPTPPHFNEKGDVPGPPLQWEEPEDLGNVEAGYGYKSNNEEENDIFFFHTDHLGSTSYLTDKDGNACEYVVYTPYGESIVDENNTDFENLFKFTGKELDRETGLHYFGARYFDKYYGIWYGPDNLREQFPMFSPYSYCNGNPVKYVDPDGNKIVVGSFWGRIAAYLGRDNFEAKTMSYIEKMKKMNPIFFKSINEMEKSSKVIYIKDINESKYKGRGGVTIGEYINKEIKQGSTIYYDASNGQNVEGEVVSPMGVLGHEFGHSENFMNGDNLKYNHKNAIPSPNQSEVDRVIGNENEKKSIFYENIIRAKEGQKERSYEYYKVYEKK